jgi:hypothetical protein
LVGPVLLNLANKTTLARMLAPYHQLEYTVNRIVHMTQEVCNKPTN